MHLYHHPLSSNARRAVMTALLLAPQLPRPVTPVLVNLMAGEHRGPDFLKLNPAGKVPVLVDGDFSLTESHAIMQHLADLAPGQTLWPAATQAQARADVNRWMFWNAQHLMPAISTLNYEHFVKPMTGRGKTDPARVALGEAEFRQLTEALNTHLAGRTWISGKAMTLADIAIATGLMHAGTAQLPLAGLANVDAWWARVKALPAWPQTEPQMPPK